MSKLTWLHLSDLHVCHPRTGWDAERVTEELCADLKRMQQQHGLRPDVIFFTGDAAYGQIGSGGGRTIVEQFESAQQFLTTVRESFTPIVDQRNLYLVPGNHDVNIRSISAFETSWLKQKDQSLQTIENTIQTAGAEWQQLMNRLGDYKRFLEQYSYEHLLTDRERLIYADIREINGLRIGIAGLNSAWSASGTGRKETGRLWMAGRFQLETLRQQLRREHPDFSIALMHHPANWLVPEENPNFGRQLERDFEFVLHGHEHQDFVRAESRNGHTVVSAGACYERSDSKNNGYNFTRLNFETGRGEVWLRQYDSDGGQWIPRIVGGITDNFGCWPLEHLGPWMKKRRENRVSQNDSAINVFITYDTRNDQDQRLHDALVGHLRGLENENIIRIHRILPGDMLPHQGINAAQIILALVSADFMNSEACETDLQRALVRHDDEGVRIVPIILRPCDWEQSPLGRFRALPSQQKAITQYSNMDAVMTQVARRLREIAQLFRRT